MYNLYFWDFRKWGFIKGNIPVDYFTVDRKYISSICKNFLVIIK